MDFFTWLEQTSFSVWVRESPALWAFPGILALHTIGMAFLVGMSVAIDLRILGVASGMPLGPMQRFFPLMWGGFLLNACSGVALLIAYPTKALTNPVFYLKLLFITFAVLSIWLLKTEVFGDPGLDKSPLPARAKKLAVASLVLWASATAAGRLLAYTYTWILAWVSH